MSVKQQVTAEEIWEMPEVPGKRLELVDGEVSEVPGAGELHIAIVVMLFKLLDRFVEQHDLGIVRPDGLAYVLRRDPDQVVDRLAVTSGRHVSRARLGVELGRAGREPGD